MQLAHQIHHRQRNAEDKRVARIGEAIRAGLQKPEQRDRNRRDTPVGVIDAGIVRDDAKDENHYSRYQVS